MKPRPFRFGVLCEQMDTQRAWVTKARQIEDAGYATLLIRDHFVRDPFGDQFAPLVALMAAADVTTRLRVGNLVLDMPSIVIGSVEQMVEQLYQRRERYGFSYYVVTDQHLQTLAPVVAQLAGKA